MSGILYGVGVGPGDPKLMTLKAVEVLNKCDVIGIPARDSNRCTAFNIAKSAVKAIKNKPVISVAVPMTTDSEKLEKAYSEGILNIISELDKGNNVAFINLGDPVVYGTYMNIHMGIVKMGYKAEIVNGVTSFCACAGKLGIPLCQGNEEIHIVPGYYGIDEIENYNGTVVLMKSAGNISEVKNKLADMEQRGNIKAYAVTDCGMESEKVCNDIMNLEDDSGYFTTIVVKKTKK